MTVVPTPVSSVLDLFAGHVRADPESLAVVATDRTLTYAELDHLSDRFAAASTAEGVRRQDVVGICLQRSAAAVAAAIGVLKAGGTLLMLDPGHPPARRAQLMAEAGATYLVDEQRMPIEVGSDVTANPPQPHESAYVVFTSGSTGVPKGVVCEHGSLANVALAQQELLAVEAGDRVALIAPFMVDAYLFELTLGLCAGATLYVTEEAQRHPGLPLRRFLRTNEITVLVATPTTLRSLDPSDHPTLRLVISAGEALDIELAHQWAPGRRMVNAYGPTEATIWSTMAEITGSESEISLGEPIPGTQVAVVRPDLTHTAVGEPGELLLSGAGVARGYLNAESDGAFVDTDAGRAYRTGDRAVRRPDGSLIFLGRDDDQVKLGGLRVDLGEIRSQMLHHPAVTDAAVREHRGRLVAYVTGPDTAALTPDDLLLFMEDRLPPQLAPTTYLVLPDLPKTLWGKLDINALPAPEEVLRRPEKSGLPALTPIQHYLVALIEELMQISGVSVTDDLFMLGLNSILVARMIDRILRDQGVELAPVDVFQNPTIVMLAESIGAPQPVTEPASS